MIQPGRIVPERCAAAYLQVSLSKSGPLCLNERTPAREAQLRRSVTSRHRPAGIDRIIVHPENSKWAE